jgi:hypothetical protein
VFYPMQPVPFSRRCITAEPSEDDEEQISHTESGLSMDKCAKRDYEDQNGYPLPHSCSMR